MATWAASANKQQTTISGIVASQTLTLGTPAVHSVLICFVVWSDSGGAQTVAISGGTGNAWASEPEMTVGSDHCQIWYCLDAHNVATTCTATYTGNVTGSQMFDGEYTVSGTGTQSTLVAGVDVETHSATGTSTTPTSAALTATFGNELWICYAGWHNSQTYSATAPYTLDTSSGARGLFEHNLNAATTAATGACGLGGSDTWMCGVVAFFVTSVGFTPGLPTGSFLPLATQGYMEAKTGAVRYILLLPASFSAAQGFIVAGSASRNGTATCPMGIGAHGGANKAPAQQVGIAQTHIE